MTGMENHHLVNVVWETVQVAIPDLEAKLHSIIS